MDTGKRLKSWLGKQKAKHWYRAIQLGKLAGGALFLGLAGAVIFAVLRAFYRVGDSELLVEYSTAFIAALIGATISLVVIWANKVAERITKHRSAVVFFQHLLAREMDEVYKMHRQLVRSRSVLGTGANFVFQGSRVNFDEQPSRGPARHRP